MGSKQYLKGARFERKIVNEARMLNKIAFRSAGSHSPIDVCIIDDEKKRIELIQCKTGSSYTQNFKEKLKEQFKYLEGTYTVYFKVMDGSNDYS